MTTFNEPQHQNDEAARVWFESLRWPGGVVCPHCGVVGHAYADLSLGLYRCAEKECRKDFTVTMRTVMESQQYRAALMGTGLHADVLKQEGH